MNELITSLNQNHDVDNDDGDNNNGGDDNVVLENNNKYICHDENVKDLILDKEANIVIEERNNEKIIMPTINENQCIIQHELKVNDNNEETDNLEFDVREEEIEVVEEKEGEGEEKIMSNNNENDIGELNVTDETIMNSIIDDDINLLDQNTNNSIEQDQNQNDDMTDNNNIIMNAKSIDGDKKHGNKNPMNRSDENEYENETKRIRYQHYSPHISGHGMMSMIDQQNTYYPYNYQYPMHMYGFRPSTNMISPMYAYGVYNHSGVVDSRPLQMMGGTGTKNVLAGKNDTLHTSNKDCETSIVYNTMARPEQEQSLEKTNKDCEKSIDNTMSRPEQEEKDNDILGDFPKGRNTHRCQAMLPPITLKDWR